MTVRHDMAIGDTPWLPVKLDSPLPPHVVEMEAGMKSQIPDCALENGGFEWWIEIEISRSSRRIMYAGGSGAGTPLEAQNTEYPDKIWDSLVILDPSLEKGT